MLVLGGGGLGREVDKGLGNSELGGSGADGRLEQELEGLLGVVDKVHAALVQLDGLNLLSELGFVEAEARLGGGEVLGEHGNNLGEVLLQGEKEGVGSGIVGVGEHTASLGLVKGMHQLDDGVAILSGVLNTGLGSAADLLEVITIEHGDLSELLEVLVGDALGDGGHALVDGLLDALLHKRGGLKAELHTGGAANILLFTLEDGAEDLHLRPVGVIHELLSTAIRAVGLVAHDPLHEASVCGAASGAGTNSGEDGDVSSALEGADESAGKGTVSTGGGGHTGGGREVVVRDNVGLLGGELSGAAVTDGAQNVLETLAGLHINLLAVKPKDIVGNLVGEEHGGLAAEGLSSKGDAEGVVGG